MSLVYFVQRDDGPIKIGFTTNLDERLLALNVGHPNPLVVLTTIPGNKKAEKYFHNMFAAHRLSGEWFSNVAELLETIAVIRTRGASFLPDEYRPVEVDNTATERMKKEIANLCREYIMGILGPFASERPPRPELFEAVAKVARISVSAVKSVYYHASPNITAHTFLSLRAAFVARHIGKSSLFETDIAIMREAARLMSERGKPPEIKAN